jgi:hypothetical protein
LAVVVVSAFGGSVIACHHRVFSVISIGGFDVFVVLHIVIFVFAIIIIVPAGCWRAAAVRAVRAVPVGYGEAVGGPGGGREGLSFALVPFGCRHQCCIGAPGVQVASGGMPAESRDQRHAWPLLNGLV